MADDKIIQGEEIWKPVGEYVGLYEVSSTGRVRSLDRWAKTSGNGLRFSPGRIMKLTTDTWGYHSVGMSRNGKTTTKSVHVLVCLAFHGPRPDGFHAAHRNGKCKDNRSDNLRWLSPKENGAEKILHGTSVRGEKNANSRLSREDVLGIMDRVSRGESTASIKRTYFPDFSITTIQDVVSGKTWGWLTRPRLER